jgi:hypothetical protein
MAEFVLSYPFSLQDGKPKTVLQDTDTYKAQQVKGLLRTAKEERPIMPDFGMNEPTFDTFDTGEFFDSFLEFYSPSVIEITEVKVLEVAGAVSDVQISFK